jgi:succinyl-diaminopimelate desuccinylase
MHVTTCVIGSLSRMKSIPPIEQLLCELIAIPSVSHDKKACSDALNVALNYIDALPGTELRMHVSDGWPSLVALHNADLEPDVMLVAHLDVVPAPEAAFTPEIKDGRVYGRGAIDMKGPASALIRAFHRHVSSKSDLSVGLMLTTDEEIGGINGVRYLLDKEKYRMKCAMLPDAGYDFGLVTLQYGIVRVHVKRRGKAGHSSRPEQGVNAIVSFIDSFKTFQGKMSELPETVMSLAIINGGIAMNVIPDLCEAKIDVRTAHPEKVYAVLQEVFDQKEFEIIADEKVFKIDPKDEHIQLYKKVAEQELKREVPIRHERGATDARFLAPYGIPVIVSAPKGFGHHQDSEWVDIEALRHCENIVVKFLDEMAKKRKEPKRKPKKGD